MLECYLKRKQANLRCKRAKELKKIQQWQWSLRLRTEKDEREIHKQAPGLFKEFSHMNISMAIEVKWEKKTK